MQKVRLLGTPLPLGRGGLGGRPPNRKPGPTNAYESQEDVNKKAQHPSPKSGQAKRNALTAVEVRLNDRLAAHNRKIDTTTPKDGNCLFHGLAGGGLLEDMGDEGMTVRQLRGMAMSMATPEQLRNAALEAGLDPDEYLKRMRTTSEYAGNLEISLLALVFRKAITVQQTDSLRTFKENGEFNGTEEGAS